MSPTSLRKHTERESRSLKMAENSGIHRRDWCSSCVLPKDQCYKENDWECITCRFHNFARAQVCRRVQMHTLRRWRPKAQKAHTRRADLQY